MSSNVVAPATPAANLQGTAAQSLQTKPQPATQSTVQPDLRLFIREANTPGRYVYTVIDQRTGKVISQLPRDEVLRMKQQPHYAAGAVFDGKA